MGSQGSRYSQKLIDLRMMLETLNSNISRSQAIRINPEQISKIDPGDPWFHQALVL